MIFANFLLLLLKCIMSLTFRNECLQFYIQSIFLHTDAYSLSQIGLPYLEYTNLWIFTWTSSAFSFDKTRSMVHASQLLFCLCRYNVYFMSMCELAGNTFIQKSIKVKEIFSEICHKGQSVLAFCLKNK